MFGIASSEMLVIVLIAVLVIGPKDIPKILYQVGRFFRRLQYVRFAMSQQFDEILKAGDIEELRKGVNFEAPKTDEKTADEQRVFDPPSKPSPLKREEGRSVEKSSPILRGEDLGGGSS